MNEKIKILGTKQMDENEISIAEGLAEKYYGKIGKAIKDSNFQLDLHIKKADITGKRCRYQIKGRVESMENGVFGSQLKVEDWELERSLHKLLKNLKSEAQNKMKSEGKARKFLFWRRR